MFYSTPYTYLVLQRTRGLLKVGNIFLFTHPNNRQCCCMLINIIGLYCSGWVKTGPVGVILTTMNKAFETANVIHEDFMKGSETN